MYTIIYKEEDKLFTEIVERMQDLSLAYALKVDRSAKNTTLQASDGEWSGNKDIMSHLTQMEEDLKKWHYCDC